MSLTAAFIAEQVQGEVVGDSTTLLTGFAAAEDAQAGDLTFAEKDVYLVAAEQSPASAILVNRSVVSSGKVLIRVADARVAMARLLPLFYPPPTPAPGIHPSAAIDATARVDPSAHIGPHVVIGKQVVVGARAALLGGNHLGDGSEVGADSCLFPNVVIYSGCRIGQRVRIHAGTVIGADGYGYTFDQGRHRKVLQVGVVVVEDDVEIGANTCIDRAALSTTVIGAGTKIDNLVHIAHNVKIGRHCLIMGQVGFAGSTELGDYCVVASQSGIAGHLKLGPQAVVGAKSGVMRDVPAKTTVLGIPAVEAKQAKRQWIATQQLPDIIRRLRAIESRLGVAPASSGQSSENT
jgi:UDP-3-O-[3-hydroxymyristoyl] glucosamine N-acyltransferase